MQKLKGRYELVRLLATGGFGRVTLARDVEMGRLVAIKSLGLREQDSARVNKLLRREGEILRSLHDPEAFGVPEVIDEFEDDGAQHLVLEYIDGEAWQTWFDSRPTLPEFLDTCARLATIVGRMHRRGVIHRDIKPSNILIRADGRPVVIDLGLAADEPSDESDVVVGTPLYMPPEAFAGKTTSGAMDVYPIGILVREGLGRRDHEVTSFAALAAWKTMADLSGEPLPQIGLPDNVEDTIRRLVALEPERRPHAHEAAQALYAAAVVTRRNPATCTLRVPLDLRWPAITDEPARRPGAQDHLSERVAILEMHLDRTRKLTESMALVIAELGQQLEPAVFQDMIRASMLLSLRDLREQGNAVPQGAATIALESLTKLPETPRAPRSTPPDTSEVTARDELLRSYTGVWGAKVFWLATLTLVPVLAGMKIHSVPLSFSPATLVFVLYHGVGIYIWASVRQAQTVPASAEVTRWTKLRGLARIHAAIGHVVVVLLVMMLFALASFRFYAQWSIPFPPFVYELLGVAPKS